MGLNTEIHFASGGSMTSCRKCGAELTASAAYCGACGTRVNGPKPEPGRRWKSEIYAYVPHPHIEDRKKKAPKAEKVVPKPLGPMGRFNAFLAVNITNAVGTMWCAYVFAALACISLPEAIRAGKSALIAWIAQTFLQLVLLSIIIVGQKVGAEASDIRADDTYKDAEAVLHEAIEIQQHLVAQDALLQKLVDGATGLKEPPGQAPRGSEGSAGPVG